MLFPRQFEAGLDGVRLRLTPGERLLLAELLDALEAQLQDPDDPALRRLFPPAYEDRSDDEQYRSIVRGQLVDGRAKALATMRGTLERDTLAPEQAEQWLRALNDLRLVLGTRLDVSEDL